MSKDLRNTLAVCIRRLAVLKGGPSNPAESADYVTGWWLAIADLAEGKYPLTADELRGATERILQKASPFFPAPGEFRKEIEDRRDATWVTLSVVVEPSNGYTPEVCARRWCPPWAVEAVTNELNALRAPELPAPSYTNEEREEKLRRLQGKPHLPTELRLVEGKSADEKRRELREDENAE